MELHIWASETALEIFDCKEDLINCILANVSEKKIKSVEELEEHALKQIN